MVITVVAGRVKIFGVWKLEKVAKKIGKILYRRFYFSRTGRQNAGNRTLN